MRTIEFQSESVILISILLCTAVSLLFVTANSVEATLKDVPIEKAGCDPDEDDNCEQLQEAQNQSSTARESTESDQTRPSDSVNNQVEDSNDVEVNEPDDKNTPDVPTIENDMYQVTIEFGEVYFNNIYERPFIPSNDDQSYLYQGDGEINLILYMNGKQIPLIKAGHYGSQLKEGHFYKLGGKYSVNLPTDMPLSIIIVGSEADNACYFGYYPKDISREVMAADGNMQLLSDLASSLRPTERCNDVRYYTPLGFINRVFGAPNYGTGTYEVSPGDTLFNDQTIIGSPNNPDYRIKYTLSAVKVPASNVVESPDSAQSSANNTNSSSKISKLDHFTFKQTTNRTLQK